MSRTRDALLQIGESTAAAVAGVLARLCPEQDGVTQGLVAAVPPGTHPMEGVPAPSVATSVSYVDGVTGGNVFVMTVKGARRLAAAMMGEALPDDDGGELSELELSAMGEAMNQMMSSAATATGSVLGKAVEIAPPEIRRFADAAEAVAAYDVTAHATTAQLSVLGEPCRLVQLIPNAFIVRMNRALSELTTDYEARADSPLSHSVRSVPLRVWAELGRVRMPLRRLVGLPAGAVVELDREVDEPIDLYVDDMRFATGRLLVTEASEWAVRIEAIHGLPASPPPASEPSPPPRVTPTTEGD